jgi:hypothetical protein
MADGGTVTNIEPSLEIAKAFWAAFTGDAATPIRLSLLHPLYSRRVNDLYPAEIEGTLYELWPKIGDYQQRGYSVYFFPNATPPGFQGNITSADVTGIRAIFIDADDGIPAEWHRAPHLIVKSSVVIKDGQEIEKGGAYWLVTGCPVEQFDIAQRTLLERYNSDPRVTDPKRVMRLPGSVHRKPARDGEGKKTGELTAPRTVTFSDDTAGMGPATAEPWETVLEGLPRASAVSRAPMAAPEGFEFDMPDNLSRARDYLRSFRVREGLWGEEDPADTYVLAAMLRDLGCSPAKCVELLTEYEEMEGEEDWLTTTVANVFRYARNECGAKALSPASWDPEALARIGASQGNAGEEVPVNGEGEADKDMAARRKRFAAILPSEAMRRPPPEYWDPEKLLVRIRGGSVNVIFAKYSNFKTTWALCHALATAKASGAKVLYIVGEGADGFGPKTVQAAVKDWNDNHPDERITGDWLDAHLRLVGAAPHLMDPKDVAALVLEHRNWNPNLVFLDTLGSAIAGEDINAPSVGTQVGRMAQQMATALRADCWLVHHTGKDASKGQMGSQYFSNDPTMILELKHDPETRRLTVRVDKDRWGQRERKVIFGTRDVIGLKIYNRQGEPVSEKGHFVAAYKLAVEEQQKTLEAGREQQSTWDQQVRDDDLKWKVIAILAKKTKTEADHVAGDALAMDLDPQAPDESQEHWQGRLKPLAELLTRLTATAETQRRTTRGGYSAGLLAPFARRTQAGMSFKPARFFLSDGYREMAKLRAKVQQNEEGDVSLQ